MNPLQIMNQTLTAEDGNETEKMKIENMVNTNTARVYLHMVICQ